MLVDSAKMVEMFTLIENRHGVSDWVEALRRVLESHPDKRNLFSEYETYGNFLLSTYPDQCRCIERRWHRLSNHRVWGVDHGVVAQARRADNAFLAIESNDKVTARALLKSLEKCHSPAIKRLAVMFCRA